ncbi:hypothetical protein NMY22_g13381 [Coprinellus aureogranulatus]|nr:hypothetical protein NMY22_g13381 [Coprinellus aureogranulatus]
MPSNTTICATAESAPSSTSWDNEEVLAIFGDLTVQLQAVGKLSSTLEAVVWCFQTAGFHFEKVANSEKASTIGSESATEDDSQSSVQKQASTTIQQWSSIRAIHQNAAIAVKSLSKGQQLWNTGFVVYCQDEEQWSTISCFAQIVKLHTPRRLALVTEDSPKQPACGSFGLHSFLFQPTLGLGVLVGSALGAIVSYAAPKDVSLTLWFWYHGSGILSSPVTSVGLIPSIWEP